MAFKGDWLSTSGALFLSVDTAKFESCLEEVGRSGSENASRTDLLGEDDAGARNPVASLLRPPQRRECHVTQWPVIVSGGDRGSARWPPLRPPGSSTPAAGTADTVTHSVRSNLRRWMAEGDTGGVFDGTRE